MKSKVLWWILGGVGILFVLGSLTITFVEYNHYKESPILFPSNSEIAGVPVDGLDQAEAEERVSEVYNLPITLTQNGTSFQATPDQLGFSFDVSSLVSQGFDQIANGRFWDHLWGRTQPEPVFVPLTAEVNEEQIITYLTQEVVPRYIQLGSPIMPISGTTNFTLPVPGETLDIESAVTDFHTALLSPTDRQVALMVDITENNQADLSTLEALIIHNIKESSFDNLVEFYLESMETGHILHFATQNGEWDQPDVAFTAASTIKIPIMISVLRHTSEPTPENVVDLMEEMIVLSENPPADTLM